MISMETIMRIAVMNNREFLEFATIASDPEEIIALYSFKERRNIVRSAVINNPYTPVSVFNEILDEEDFQQYIFQIAEKPTLSKESCEKLLKKYNGTNLKNKIAEKNVNQDVLNMLSKDSAWWIRAAVARNKNISQETRQTLLNDENNYVRKAVVNL